MRNLRSMLILGLLLAFPTLGSAELKFPHPCADLGELRGGPAYQHRFEFGNDSSEPIEILEIRLGCGCLQPILDKRLFQPGEKGSLLMHIRTLGQPNGARTWQARVQYRQGETQHETTLTLAATLRHEITVEPSILSMTVGTTLRQEVIVTDHRALPGKIVGVQSTSPALRVSLQPAINGVTKILLEVSGASLTAARQEEMLNITMDDPNYRLLQVPVTLTKASRSLVSATPEKVEFRGTPAGSRIVRLRALGDQKITVMQAESDHPAVKCTWASGPGNDATLRISLDERSLSSTEIQTSVRIRLMEPEGATIGVPVMIRKE